MAYREFDPAAMKTYQEKAIQMFNDQITAASTMITSKTNQKAQKEKDKAAAEKLAETAMMTVYDGLGILKEVEDTTTRTAARAKAKKLGEEIEALEKEIAALNSAVDSLNSAITETTGYINGIMKSIEELDYTSENKIIELIAGINTYKRMLRNIYNTMDDTLVEHGYSRDVNIQQQFSNTLDDWGDSTVVNKFKYIPASYIYRDGELNERILSGIFQKNPETVIDTQYRELMDVLSSIVNNNSWNDLSGFINTGYAFYAETGNYQDSEKTYMLTKTFKELSSRYTQKTLTNVFQSIKSGKTIEELSDFEKKELQISALINSFGSQWPFIITSEEGKGTPFTLSKDTIGGTSGLRVTINPYYKSKNFGGDSWFISDFQNSLSKSLGNFIADVTTEKKNDAYKVAIFDAMVSKMLGLFSGLSDLADIAGGYGDYVEQQSEYDNTIMLGRLSSIFDTMAFGGVLSVGRNGQVGVDSTLLGLNGSTGFGVSMEAYNFFNDTFYNVESLYDTLMNPKEEVPYQMSNLIDWINEQEHNDRDKYATTIISISGNLDSESSYWDYKNIITDPELSKQLADRLSKQSGE